MSSYTVPMSWDFTVEADSPEEARQLVVFAVDRMLPGDTWILGETLSAEYMVGDAEFLRDNDE